MFRNLLIYLYFFMCVSVFFAIEQTILGIKLEIPLEWIIPIFNFGLILYTWKNRSTLTKIKKIYLVALFLFAISLVFSTLTSEIVQYSIKGTVLWFSYAFAFAGGFWILNLDTKEKQKFLILCATSYSILLLYSLVHYLIIGIRYHNSYKMALPFVNGHTLLIAMAFPLWIHCFNAWIKKPNKNMFIVSFLILYTVTIYLSYSRFYWVITTVSMILIFLYHYPKWIKVIIIAGIIFSIIAYAAYLKISEYRDKNQVWLDPKDHTTLFVQIESIFVLGKNESNYERKNRWKASMLMFSENIWTGIGINTFPERYAYYLAKIPENKIHITTRTNVYMNAHNVYLGTMAEQGILGLISLSFFIGIWIYYFKKLSFVVKLIFVHYLLLGVIEDFTLLVDIIPCFWVCVSWGIKNLQESTIP